MRECKRRCGLDGWGGGKIWEELGEKNHNQNTLYKKKICSQLKNKNKTAGW